MTVPCSALIKQFARVAPAEWEVNKDCAENGIVLILNPPWDTRPFPAQCHTLDVSMILGWLPDWDIEKNDGEITMVALGLNAVYADSLFEAVLWLLVTYCKQLKRDDL